MTDFRNIQLPYPADIICILRNHGILRQPLLNLICVGNLNHHTPFDLLDGAFCRIGRHVPDLIKLHIGFIYMFL